MLWFLPTRSNPEVDIMMDTLFLPLKVEEILMNFKGISVLESVSWGYASEYL